MTQTHIPDIPDSDIWTEFSHSSGPGGQHANKTATRVTLCFAPAHASGLSDAQKRRVLHALAGRLDSNGILRITDQSSRSQSLNRHTARQRLLALLAEALRPRKTRRPTKPTRASKQRRLQAKQRRSEIKTARRKPEQP